MGYLACTLEQLLPHSFGPLDLTHQANMSLLLEPRDNSLGVLDGGHVEQGVNSEMVEVARQGRGRINDLRYIKLRVVWCLLRACWRPDHGVVWCLLRACSRPTQNIIKNK